MLTGGVRVARRAFQHALRPGARIALLNTDPAHYGLTCTFIRTGETDVRHQRGEPVPVHLRARDDTWTTFTNYHWPLQHYPDLPARAGLTDISQ